jgi:hypothetical protein
MLKYNKRELLFAYNPRIKQHAQLSQNFSLWKNWRSSYIRAYMIYMSTQLSPTLGLLFYPEDAGSTFYRTTSRHIQKTAMFIAIAVRTSNLTLPPFCGPPNSFCVVRLVQADVRPQYEHAKLRTLVHFRTQPIMASVTQLNGADRSERMTRRDYRGNAKCK